MLWNVHRYKRLTLSTVVEKPTREYGRANLATPGLAKGEYLTAFGLYVVHGVIFDYLEEQKAARDAVGPTAGLLQLTPALDRVRAEEGLDGILLDGERYDIGGNPRTYLSTLNAFGADRPAGPERGQSLAHELGEASLS